MMLTNRTKPTLFIDSVDDTESNPETVQERTEGTVAAVHYEPKKKVEKQGEQNNKFQSSQ